MSLYRLVDSLVQYGLSTSLISEDDRFYVTNRILALFGETGYDGAFLSDEAFARALDENRGQALKSLLETMADAGIERGVCGDSAHERRIFTVSLMDTLMPRPSEVVRIFKEKYAISPETATDWYYNLSLDSDYIRRSGLQEDVRWNYDTQYGWMQILISLTKPEKDPKDILAAKTARTGYPKCALCKENEGYRGRAGAEARSNHRIIPVTLDGEPFYFQYSPYGYCPHHCIFFSSVHRPMAIDDACLRKILDAVTLFPHYFVGSNTDLPYVGGSILAHDHFQGGMYRLPVFDAHDREECDLGDDSVKVTILEWPVSTVKLRGKDRESVFRTASSVLRVWRRYSDSSVDILASTEGEIHNTLTPIACREGDDYVMVLILRNNRRTPERSDALFHVAPERFHLKKEGLGVIDVPGIAIFPPRLKKELSMVASEIKEGKGIGLSPETEKHRAWVESFLPSYPGIQDMSLEEIVCAVKAETGKEFTHMLEDAGVFKCTPEGKAAFRRYMEECARENGKR